MKRLVVLLTLFLLITAERQDLSGKMFTFPVESDTHHVALSPEMNKIFTTVTVCLRSFSDISRGQSLFSLSLPSNDNAFLIEDTQEAYNVYVLGQLVQFYGLHGKSNVWNSVCATWDANTGLAQLWVNGYPSSRKGLKKGHPLTGTPKIILAQDQDNYGGGFAASESFVGMMTDVHMWDYVLPSDEIAHYTYSSQPSKPGNVLNWSSLEFTKKGDVIIESKETSHKASSV